MQSEKMHKGAKHIAVVHKATGARTFLEIKFWNSESEKKLWKPVQANSAKNIEVQLL